MKIIGKIRKAVSYIFILPISAYRKFISPLFPQTCKYYPSCSAYAIEAYKKHGAVIGTVLTIWRLLRCNPFSYGGVDYVPEKIDIGYFIPKNLKKKSKKNS